MYDKPKAKINTEGFSGMTISLSQWHKEKKCQEKETTLISGKIYKRS